MLILIFTVDKLLGGYDFFGTIPYLREMPWNLIFFFLFLVKWISFGWEVLWLLNRGSREFTWALKWYNWIVDDGFS